MINIKKKISLLTSLRIFAALLLLTLVLDIYDWQADIMWYKQLIPFIYLYAFDATSTNNISVLMIPLLVNIALWLPCYRSYLFLMVVLYVEYMKFIVMIPFLLIVLPFSPLFQRNNPLPTFLMVVFLIFVVRAVIAELKTEQYKKLFMVDMISKVDFDRATVKMVVVFCLLVSIPNAIEYYVVEKVPSSYAVAETKDLHTTVLTPERVKLSKDEKLFLVREYNKDTKTTSFIITDVDNMQNVKTMQMPPITGNKFTFSGYTFTNDNKYIIVGDDLSNAKGVNFQVYNIETGKMDDRFSKSENLSSIEPSKKLKAIKHIEFNRDGRYFITVDQASGQIEIWDYIKGKLVYTDIPAKYIRSAMWISDRKILVNYDSNDNGRNIELVEYELLQNESVLKTEKQKIAQGISVKSERIKRIKSSYGGKYLAACTSNTDFQRITIWDIQKQEIISTIFRNSKATDMTFHPDGEKIIVLDIFKNGTEPIISIWDIKSGRKEREIYIKDLSNHLYALIEMVDNGHKVMIINESVHFVRLD